MANAPDRLNETAQALVAELRRAFPDWSHLIFGYGPSDDPEAEPGSIQLAVPSPAHQAHMLRVLLRGNTVDVCYDDAKAPGPAERLFILEVPELEGGARAVVDFVQQIVDETMLIVREPLDVVTRLLRTDCTDLPWFRTSKEVAARPPDRYRSVYSWRGTYSRPPTGGAA